MNGTAGAHGGEDYQQWMEGKVAQGKVSPQIQRHGGEVYSNTLPVRKVAPAKSKTTLSKDMLFPMSALFINRMKYASSETLVLSLQDV